MDKIDIAFRVIKLVGGIHREKMPDVPMPDPADYRVGVSPQGALDAGQAHNLPLASSNLAPAIKLTEQEEILYRPLVAEQPKTIEGSQKTGCLACGRSHISTVSGALNESLRFAREGGVQHPEVVRRLSMAEDEINIMERVDFASDKLLASPEAEQQLAEHFLPAIRAVRQAISEVSNVAELTAVSAAASTLAQDFRLEHIKLLAKKK